VKLQRTFDFPTALFGIIPMLNVLFLLLVFYVLGSRFVLTPGVQVSLPSTSFAVGPQRNSEIVSITAGPAAAIYHRDRAVTLSELRDRLAENRSPDRWLIVRADRNTPAGVLASVTDEALRRGYSVILAGDTPKQ
jgi:biopolymer transport protein ExbD